MLFLFAFLRFDAYRRPYIISEAKIKHREQRTTYQNIKILNTLLWQDYKTMKQQISVSNSHLAKTEDRYS